MKRLIAYALPVFFAAPVICSASTYTVQTEQILNSNKHVYVLQATYTLNLDSVAAQVSKIPAGCMRFSCWDDHWETTLSYNNGPENKVQFQFIDKTEKKVIGEKSVHLGLRSNSVDTQTLSESPILTAPQELFVQEDGRGLENIQFQLPGSQLQMVFAFPILDDLYRDSKVDIAYAGSDGYQINNLEYGGTTASALTFPVQPGSRFPGRAVWLQKFDGDVNAIDVSGPDADNFYHQARIKIVHVSKSN